MPKKQKEPFEDGGRTIADMSFVESASTSLIGRLPYRREKKNEEASRNAEPLTKRQNRAAIGGALLAALVIGGVFIVAGAIAIGVMLAIWT